MRPLTGGAFNPARSLGPALAGGGWTAHWLYWVAPIAGMVAAMHVYEGLRPASAVVVATDVPFGVDAREPAVRESLFLSLKHQYILIRRRRR